MDEGTIINKIRKHTNPIPKHDLKYTSYIKFQNFYTHHKHSSDINHLNKIQGTLAGEAGRLNKELHFSLSSSISNTRPPVSLPSLQQSTCYSLSSPPQPPSPMDLTNLNLLISLTTLIALSQSKFQQAFPENPQVTLSRQLGKLSSNLYLSLLTFKFNLPASCLPLHRSHAVPLFTPPLCQDTKQILDKYHSFYPPVDPFYITYSLVQPHF